MLPDAVVRAVDEAQRLCPKVAGLDYARTIQLAADVPIRDQIERYLKQMASPALTDPCAAARDALLSPSKYAMESAIDEARSSIGCIADVARLIDASYQYADLLDAASAAALGEIPSSRASDAAVLLGDAAGLLAARDACLPSVMDEAIQANRAANAVASLDVAFPDAYLGNLHDMCLATAAPIEMPPPPRVWSRRPSEAASELSGVGRSATAHRIVFILERALRAFIDERLSGTFGEDWLIEIVPSAMRSNWETRRKHQGAAHAGTALIEFATVGEYRSIIKQPDVWSAALSRDFDDPEEVDRILLSVNQCRRDVAHSRDVTPDALEALYVNAKTILQVIAPDQADALPGRILFCA